MTSWPESLPQKFLARGYEEKTPNNVLRTAMDQGRDKRRRKSTDAVWLFSGVLRLTKEQVATWLTFYYDTIQETGSFDFLHPRTGEVISVSVFNNTESAPPLRAVSANDRFELTLVLEWSR